jgi:hypothetical protein
MTCCCARLSFTEPNKFVAEVHDRMPVFLEVKDFEQREHGDTKDAALMTPAGEDVLQKSPVSKRGNRSRAPDDDASLIELIEKARPAVRWPIVATGTGGRAVRSLARFASVRCTPVRGLKVKPRVYIKSTRSGASAVIAADRRARRKSAVVSAVRGPG